MIALILAVTAAAASDAPRCRGVALDAAVGHYADVARAMDPRRTASLYAADGVLVGPKGEPVTGESLARLYLDVTRKYYGHSSGVCIVDDYIAHEWSFIPHFYRDFYVFQYATSFMASEALAAKVKAGDRTAKERYLKFLSAGGSAYPIDLLREAGVDMTTDEPLDLTIKTMNRVMDEMEAIMARRRPTAANEKR